MHCNTKQRQRAIEALCRIHEMGQLGQLVQDFSFRRRELVEDDPLRIAYVDLDAKEIGRAAEHLLGMSAVDAAAMARKIMLSVGRRELALKMIHEADPGDHIRDHQRQQQVQPGVIGRLSAVDRANRLAAVHRNKTKRRASA